MSAVVGFFRSASPAIAKTPLLSRERAGNGGEAIVPRPRRLFRSKTVSPDQRRRLSDRDSDPRSDRRRARAYCTRSMYVQDLLVTVVGHDVVRARTWCFTFRSGRVLVWFIAHAVDPRGSTVFTPCRVTRRSIFSRVRCYETLIKLSFRVKQKKKKLKTKIKITSHHGSYFGPRTRRAAYRIPRKR